MELLYTSRAKDKGYPVWDMLNLRCLLVIRERNSKLTAGNQEADLDWKYVYLYLRVLSVWNVFNATELNEITYSWGEYREKFL